MNCHAKQADIPVFVWHFVEKLEAYHYFHLYYGLKKYKLWMCIPQIEEFGRTSTKSEIVKIEIVINKSTSFSNTKSKSLNGWKLTMLLLKVHRKLLFNSMLHTLFLSCPGLFHSVSCYAGAFQLFWYSFLWYRNRVWQTGVQVPECVRPIS